jgi:hypothetical protein
VIAELRIQRSGCIVDNGVAQSASKQSSPDCPCSPSGDGYRTS